MFPQVTADAGLDLSSGILAPLQAIGLFGGSSTKVTLGFNDVRTYGVSPLLAEGLAQHMVCARVGSPALATDLDFIRRQAEAEDAAGPVAPFGQRRVQYRVISKIYLTRQITYTYSNVQILALAQGRSPPMARARPTRRRRRRP